MRKLGLIGGMSWYSTRSYYEHINRGVQARAGTVTSAPLIIESLDFAQLYRLSEKHQWDHAATILADSAVRLQHAGATALLICANSMHRVYDEVAAAVSVPIFHIARCIGRQMDQDGIRKAALIGTRNVMTENFYREKLIEYGIELLAPDMRFTETLDRIIYDELMVGRATRASERELKSILTQLSQGGAEAVVLASTEFGMIVNVDATVVPVYDCTRLHAGIGVRWIMGEDVTCCSSL